MYFKKSLIVVDFPFCNDVLICNAAVSALYAWNGCLITLTIEKASRQIPFFPFERERELYLTNIFQVTS